jgi:hypothetical protein
MSSIILEIVSTTLEDGHQLEGTAGHEQGSRISVSVVGQSGAFRWAQKLTAGGNLQIWGTI